jgi:hypothetical protein
MGFGKVIECYNPNQRQLTIENFHFLDFVILFFDRHPLHGDKLLNYRDWRHGVFMIGLHRTDDGLRTLHYIYRGMNRGRYSNGAILVKGNYRSKI